MMILRLGLLFLIVISFEVRAQNREEKRPDSVQMPASLKYADAGIFKKLFWGSNYREVWETPVKAPVFRISESGYKITELGGGQQTLSLRLKDSKGREWVLRSVDKDVSKVLLPPFLPKTLVLPLIQDIISASFPYSPVVVYELARLSGIIAARPVLYWVADDPALGEHRQLFANTFCYLEQREPTPDDSDTKSTRNVLEDLMEENENIVIQKAVLKARLLDMLVADWDRHADQWRWDKVEGGGIQYYYGIPRDRDQAFFQSNGIVVKLAQWTGMKQLVGFQHDLHLKKLNKKSWTFDRTFLNELDREEWQAGIREFQQSLPDAEIEQAVKKLPPEIFRMEGKKIMEKLIKRRNDLEREALKYYDHISRVVVINGTPDDENFYFKNHGEDLEISVVDKKTGISSYTRRFNASTTWKVLISGRGGNDSWLMAENTSSRIRLEIEGGSEKDHYQLKGTVRTLILDDKKGNNIFENGSRIRKKLR